MTPETGDASDQLQPQASPTRGTAPSPAGYGPPPQAPAGYGPPQYAPAASGPPQQYAPAPYGVPQQYAPGVQQYGGPVLAFAAKETGLAYLLWFFLGNFGAHKFYLGKTGIGIAYLTLGLLGWMTIWLFGLGLLFLLPLWGMQVVDLFTMSSQVRASNEARLRGQVPSGF